MTRHDRLPDVRLLFGRAAVVWIVAAALAVALVGALVGNWLRIDPVDLKTPPAPHLAAV